MTERQLSRVQARLDRFLEELVEPMGRGARRHWSQVYLQGLLLDGQRKSAQAMAERVGGGDEQALNQFLNQSPWEVAEIGYNPGKPGGRKIWLNRGDLGLGHGAIMSWREEAHERPKYLFKLKLTNLVRSALCRVREDEWQGSASTGACRMAEDTIQLTGWERPRRVIFARTLLGVIRAASNTEFWDRNKHEFAVYVTNLPESVNPWQIQELYRTRADTEKVFDELKNQLGFSGFCAKSRSTTELAARLLLLVYNLWTLFVRFIVWQKHTEAKRGRLRFLLIAARLVESGRQKELEVSIKGSWADQLRDGYTRITEWIRTTAPQLQYQMSTSDLDLANAATSGPKNPTSTAEFRFIVETVFRLLSDLSCSILPTPVMFTNICSLIDTRRAIGTL